MQNPAIFPLFYLPPVSYFTLLKEHNFEFDLEKFEHFPKQTYRNRATIASPNGSLDMVVPIVKGAKQHTPYKDVKISYQDRWQRLHWLSLQTCYRSSAYFEFYEDGLAPFYEKKYDFLFDYNCDILTWLFKQLKITSPLNTTASYETDIAIDYRNVMTKKEIPTIQTKPYFQVFSDRNEFIANLSIVDLIFNQGPQAKNYF
ncbi:WbqC family protein [Pedobacter sp. SL55]|uniref:WbqC family protein n=1 Tax=Pedobacter sp. SL55 TaxID=2995161 RepID=UPI002271372C|nr:WbqC family protein [Pedobacter sp. SL55]WAC40240.1 WbqC family protein [Pedobacter sp. SL55]